jgi:hypothetical protein
MKKPLAGTLFAATAAACAIGLSATSAVADSTITATYPVNGSTSIVKTNSSLTLGPGTLSAVADLTTGKLTGNITLPPATGSFTELLIVPVTATVKFTQVGKTRGTVNVAKDTVTATSKITLQITDLKVAGLDVPVGPACQTVTPAVIKVTSGTGFTIGGGGPVSGTYTIPQFANCFLETLVINLTIPGPGNTISLTLGKPTLG